MSATDSSASPLEPPPGCPMHGRLLPSDGIPLRASPTLEAWREEGAATPLQYEDGHEGWIVTRHELAQAVLSDPRFSQVPQRMPGGSHETGWSEDVIDAGAQEALRVANLLSLDEPEHSRLRRLIASRFSVKASRARRDRIAEIVDAQIEHLRSLGSPADLTVEFAQPISVRGHCDVLGIPDSHAAEFARLFVGKSTTQERFDFLRDVIAVKRGSLGEDVISDLIQSEASEAEVEGLTLVLMSSGRDSVAYMIATATVALLTNPDQLAALRANPELLPNAIEEFMRFGAMFITLFPRTATEDVELPGLTVMAGQSVSVSPVGANRDERRFHDPGTFDIQRDGFGHLGFGHGLHGCMGQQLARVEISEAISHLLDAFPDLALVEAEQLEPLPFAHPVATYEAGAVIVAW